MSISGLTSDARTLARFLRGECTSSKWAFDEPLPVGRLVGALGEKLQRCTQFWSRRPFGVGLLVAGYDASGPHVYEVQPSANYFDCKSMAIGARSQSARTYLEKNMDQFSDSDLESLVAHGLRALRDTLPNEVELSNKNVSIAVVGQGTEFTIHEDAQVDPYLELISGEERRGGGAQPPAEGEEGAMETD